MTWFDAVFLSLAAGETGGDGDEPAPAALLLLMLLGSYPDAQSLLGAALLWPLGRALLRSLRHPEAGVARRLVACAVLYYSLLPLRYL